MASALIILISNDTAALLETSTGASVRQTGAPGTINTRKDPVMNRRSFLQHTGFTTAVFPSIVPAEVLGRPGRPGANERIQVGVIGVGGRARAIFKDEGLPASAEVVAVADCYYPRCEEAAKWIPGGERWSKFSSYRAMLDQARLDAVFVETTTHARVLACLDAIQAGCDVYAEKPISLTISEGRVLADAVQKTGRVLQVGSQQRSMPINQFASKLVREGAIGPVKEVITFNFLPPLDWMPRAAQPIPQGLDWNAWCNQTELRPYHSSLQFGWSNYFEYDGGGQSWGVTGWGTHSLDQVQCALGTDETGPVEVWTEEAVPHPRVTMRYASGTLLKLAGAKRGYEDLGAIFVGERGRIEIRRGSAVADPPELLQGSPPDSPSVRPGETVPHLENFCTCIATRGKPNAPAEAGHRATTLCHLVNIARALNRRLYWDPQSERFTGDDEANSFLSRPRRKGFELPDV
jgi:predicted dehydrogenase